VPADDEPWAVPSTTVKARFDEPVLDVDEQSFLLIRASNGRSEHASVSYSSSSRTASLRPTQPLAPGWYDARLTNDITDRAGNALLGVSWSFRVTGASPDAGGQVDGQVVLRPGTHKGYEFDGGGHVEDTKRIHPETSRSVSADMRATQPGLPGYWLRLTSGGLAGYWVRESGSAGLTGVIGRDSFDSRRVILRPGTHVGLRFDGGNVRAKRSYRTTTTARTTADQRAVINGVSRLRISGGALDAFWVVESAVAYLPGAVQVTDLWSRRATVGQGKRTGYRYSSKGAVLSAKSSTLPATQSTPVAAWAIINGRPSFYLMSGRWAAHWLVASAGVHLP
jgi:hypothetical protein